MNWQYPYIERPNHDLHYSIGEDFCLEETTENSFFTVSCSLTYSVSPRPVFQFRIFQNATLLLDSYDLDNFTSTTSESEKWLSINGTILPEELGITIECYIFNTNGNDSASTLLTRCSKCQWKSLGRLSWPHWPDSCHQWHSYYRLSIIILDSTECQDGVTHTCAQLCTRNEADGHMHHICSCKEGYKLSAETLDGSCVGEYIIIVVQSYKTMCICVLCNSI